MAYNTLISLAVLCAAIGVSVGQSNNPTTQQSCAAATPMSNFNVTKFVGVWYEVARNPAPSSTLECIELTVKVIPDTSILNIQLTYANTPSALWQNKTVSNNITMVNNANGYNVTFVSTTNTTIKLLDTDYLNYASICGYTNKSDESTAFGAIFTRLRVPSPSDLVTYENNASNKYLNFWSSNMTNITQSSQCYTNSQSTALPMFTAMCAALFVLLKFLN